MNKLKKNINEHLARLLIVVMLVGLPFLFYQFAPWKSHDGKRIIFLTAIASQGIWTEDIVNGTNYWNTKFKRAKVILRKGEDVILRFTSIDVTHTFYAPEIGIGPVEVLPGHVYDVPFKAAKTGRFTYYCTTVCGHCHYFMQGIVLILNEGDISFVDIFDNIKKENTCILCVNPAVNANSGSAFIERGKTLFKDKGCFMCHGIEGKGGVHNPNYAKYFVPSLNTLANKLKISQKEDADSIINLMVSRANLEKLNDNPPFRTYNRFFAQYTSITKKILDGAPKVLRADSTSFEPPLVMPSWENSLPREDIDAIIAYLISVYNWDED